MLFPGPDTFMKGIQFIWFHRKRKIFIAISFQLQTNSHYICVTFFSNSKRIHFLFNGSIFINIQPVSLPFWDRYCKRYQQIHIELSTSRPEILETPASKLYWSSKAKFQLIRALKFIIIQKKRENFLFYSNKCEFKNNALLVMIWNVTFHVNNVPSIPFVVYQGMVM